MSVIEIPWILKENEIISEKAPNLRWTKDFMKDMFTTNPNHIICLYPLKGDTEVYIRRKVRNEKRFTR